MWLLKRRIHAGVQTMTDRVEYTKEGRAEYWRSAGAGAVTDAACDEFGQPNERLSNKSELRFGNKGSVSVELTGEKAGSYFDHEKGEGGQLLIPNGCVSSLVSAPPKPKVGGNRNLGTARMIWAQGVSLKGTAGEDYLTARGLTEGHDHLRWHKRKGCILAGAFDDDGEIAGIQQIKPSDTPGKAEYKKSHGPVGNGRVVFGRGRTVLVAEGVEDALAALTAVPDSTCVAMLGQQWKQAAERYPGATFCADADEGSREGAGKAARVAGGLLWTPPQPHKDLNDVLVADGAEALSRDISGTTEAEEEPRVLKLPSFAPLGEIDFSTIRRTDFLYRDFYARGYTSLTVAAPKVGKSALALAEAMDMASAGKLYGVNTEPRRVMYLNAEDDAEAMRGRYAANCIAAGLKQSDFERRFALQSCISFPDLFLAETTGNGVAINERVFQHFAAEIEEHETDVLVFDPLQDMSHADETNEAFRALGQRLRRLAAEAGIAVHLIHHTRKVAPGVTPSIDDSRGGSALRGTSRFNRVLVAMSEAEGLKAGVDDPRYYFRIGEVESNLAPPSSARNQWFVKTGKTLPNGENVLALRKWEWPDAFDGITLDMAIAARNELAAMSPEDARRNPQAKEWFGHVAARVCGIELPTNRDSKKFKAGRAKVEQILSQWTDNGWIKVEQIKDPGSRKDVPIYTVGSAHPNDQ